MQPVEKVGEYNKKHIVPMFQSSPTYILVHVVITTLQSEL